MWNTECYDFRRWPGKLGHQLDVLRPEKRLSVLFPSGPAESHARRELKQNIFRKNPRHEGLFGPLVQHARKYSFFFGAVDVRLRNFTDASLHVVSQRCPGVLRADALRNRACRGWTGRLRRRFRLISVCMDLCQVPAHSHHLLSVQDKLQIVRPRPPTTQKQILIFVPRAADFVCINGVWTFFGTKNVTDQFNVTGVVVVRGNLTFSSNVTLRFDVGAVLNVTQCASIDGGFTLVVSVSVAAASFLLFESVPSLNFTPSCPTRCCRMQPTQPTAYCYWSSSLTALVEPRLTFNSFRPIRPANALMLNRNTGTQLHQIEHR